MIKTRSILIAGWIAVGLAGSAHGQFVPGRVFVAKSPGKLCMEQHLFGHDQIWEIDPETAEVTLFVQIPEELCGFLTGLAFTPDGTRLRASSFLRSEILEFDSAGNMTVVLGFSDGIVGPGRLNNLAYDADGNFYVANELSRDIVRFAADGGPATVFADETDGVGLLDAIAFAADKDMYFTTLLNNITQLRRITPDGNASTFDTFGSRTGGPGVAADDSGHVYIALTSGEIFRYVVGNPESKELLAVVPCSICSITMSADQRRIYLWRKPFLFGIDRVDGTVAAVAEVPADAGPPAGIAVAPIPPPPIPTVSAWDLCVMTLLVVTGATILIQRGRRVIA